MINGTTFRPSMQPAQASGRTNMAGSDCKLQGCEKLRGSDPKAQFGISIILNSPKPIDEPNGIFQSVDGADYAATPQQIKSVEQFAKASGLSIASVDPKTRTVKLQGDTASYEKAFGVKLNEYKDTKGNQFRAFDGQLSMPKALAGNVQGVLGLSNRPIASPRNSGFKATPKDMPTNGYTAPQIAQAYNFPKGLDGKGQTISIIELGGGYNDADIKQYFDKLGVHPNVKSVSVDGATNTPANDPNSADGEVDLDIEVAGGVAPGANINVYFAPNSEQGFVDAVNQAAHDNPKNNTVSISWGSNEDNGNLWTEQARGAFNDVLKSAAATGVNVYVASGDNGSDDGVGDNANHVDFPSASPWTISTGGTFLTTDARGNKANEVAWGGTPGDGASGGGVSQFFPLPDYQKGAGVPASPTAGGGRGVPDVSGNADPQSGYEVIVDGMDGAIGGTSAVAPLYAGLTALLGQGAGGDLGFLNPFYYKNPGAFNDITQGTNGNFNAGPGWDAVTGLGSPDGTKLLAALKAAKAAHQA
jgi:kumamolisin